MELDAVLRSSRRHVSPSSSASAQSELAALQAELAREEALDRQLAALTLPQRIARRLRQRQLGWKLLAVLLALAAMSASLQLLASKQRRKAEKELSDVGLGRLREEAERREAEVAGLTRHLVDRLTRVGAGVCAQRGPGSDDCRWVRALQRRVEEVERGSAVCSAEEGATRQRISALEQRLATKSRQA